MAKPTEDQLNLIRQAFGLDADVPLSDIEELAGTKAGMAALKRIEGQGQRGLGQEIGSFLSGGVNALEQAKGTKGLENLFSNIGGKKPVPKKSDPKQATKGMSEQDALQQLAQWLSSNYVQQGAIAMGQEGQQLAQQNNMVTGLVDQQFQQAGAASGNPAVQAAMNAFTKAYTAGESLNSGAYANMGIANQQYISQSPLYPIANLLTQGFGSTQYKELPANVVQALPANVQAALAQAGVTESTTSGGSGTPIKVSGAANNVPTNLAQILGLNQNATNPNINTSIGQTTTPGNPNIPSGQ